MCTIVGLLKGESLTPVSSWTIVFTRLSALMHEADDEVVQEL